VNKQKNN